MDGDVTPRRWHRAALVGASFFFVHGATIATPQVVGDEACEYYAVDIEAFATCTDGKVTVPEDTEVGG
jgi:hypothetical protein